MAILVNNACAYAIKPFFEFFELCYRGLADRGQATDTLKSCGKYFTDKVVIFTFQSLIY